MASQNHDGKCIIDEQEAGSRLDRMLMRCAGEHQRSLILRLIRKGNVRVNGKRVKPELRLQSGDVVFLPMSLRGDSNVSSAVATSLPKLPPIETLYEDDDIWIVNKPAGIVVHGGSGHDAGLIEALKVSHGLDELRLAHRLDRDTSGCLLLAKNLSSLRALTEDFRERDVQKTYFAWVEGHPYPYAGCLSSKLSKGMVRGGERMVVEDEHGQDALTDYQVMLIARRESFDYALAALRPHSGRTHQLRVQLQHQGHAILGDGKYASQESLKQSKRYLHCKHLALHAWRLRIQHPKTQQWLDVRADFPARWKAVFADVAQDLCEDIS